MTETFQPTDQPESTPESIQADAQAEQTTGKEIFPEGYVFTDDEEIKQFYLELALRMCPSLTSDYTEIKKLSTLHNHINKTCKLLSLLDSYPWTDFPPLLMKACGFYMLMDSQSSKVEKRQLNDWLYMHTQFTSKAAELHPLVTHSLHFFSWIRSNLEKILRIDRGGNEVNQNQNEAE